MLVVGWGEGGQVGSSSVGSSVGGLSVVGSSVSSSSSLLSYILEKIIFIDWKSIWRIRIENVLRHGVFLAQIPTDMLCFFLCRMRVSDGKKCQNK